MNQKQTKAHVQALWAWKVRAGLITDREVKRLAAHYAYGPGGLRRVYGPRAA